MGDGARSATFVWTLGRAEVCPIRVRLVGSFAVRPCAAIDGGALSTSTNGVTGARNPERAWVDVAMEARLEWRLLNRVSLELAGGLLVPFARDTFVFEPAPAVTDYRAPAIAGVGSLGVMVFFL